MPKNPHANFSPVLDGYTGQGAFRFWCQMALPLTYDDSLSYYELLNKVVTYLNNTISDVSAVETNVGRLSEAYNQLQDYVNDYFDDLDVEEELRNVLDKMALDGSLDAILTPLVEEALPDIVDDKIDDVVADQIDNVVAEQISAVVENQLPPLVEENVPDAVTEWLDENVNPVGSAVIVDPTLSISGAAADAKVTGDKTSYLKTQIGYEEITGWSEFTEKQYINLSSTTVTIADGHIVSSTAANNVRYVEVAASEGDKFTVSTTGGGNSPRAYGFVSATGSVLEKANSNTTLTNQLLIAPANTAFLVINDMQGDAKAIYGEYIGVTVNRLDQAVKSLVPSEGTEITHDLVWSNTSSIRSDNGNVIYSADLMTSQLVDITGISCIRFESINTPEGGLRSALAFYASDESFISAVQRFDETTGYRFIEVLIPNEAKYVRMSKFKEETKPFRAFVVSANKYEPNANIIENARNIADIKNQIGYEKITGWSKFNEKQYINLGSTSVTITDGHIVPTTGSNNVRYVEVTASEGERFTITTKGGGGSRAYGFVSATGSVLEKANANATLTNQVVKAPAGTAFLVINDMQGDAEAIYGEYIGVEVNRLDQEVEQLLTDNIKPICSKDATKVYIYVPTSNKKYYIGYKLVKVSNAAQYASGWRLSEIKMLNLDKTGVGNSTIMGTGEWETALAIPYESSTVYMGLGNHGYEEQVAGGFALFIDGKEVGEDDVFDDRAFEEIQLVNKLEMLDPRMAENPNTIGYHTRIDTINGVKKTITIENKLEFTNATSIPISQGYLFMASLERKYPANSDNLITNQFIDNVDYVLTDCSTATFDPSDANHGVGENKPDVTEYKFWGDYFDLWGYAKILRREVYAPRIIGNDHYNQFLPSNTVKNYTNQNKIYMSVCREGDAIAGDIWRMTTEFFMDCGYNPTT